MARTNQINPKKPVQGKQKSSRLQRTTQSPATTTHGSALSPTTPLTPDKILQLQRTIGNQAAHRLIQSQRTRHQQTTPPHSLTKAGQIQREAKKKKAKPKKFKISASVGQKAGKSVPKNKPADILQVQQHLLKLQYLSQSDFDKESVFDPDLKRIPTESIPATITAIKWYQRAVVNVTNPDGLISAKGGTAKKLKQSLGQRDKIADTFRAFGLTQDLTRSLCEKGSTEDIINFVNQAINDFPDPMLKKQIGTSIINRTDFLIGMTAYRGSLEEVINHFSSITHVTEVPGNVHLHQSAADKLVGVSNTMAQLNLPMPATTVALGLRGRYRPHDRIGKSFNAHPMGFAIDYRAPSNPKITDKRTIALIKVMTGEVSNFQLFDRKGRPLTADLYTKRSSARRKLIRRFGEHFPNQTMSTDLQKDARHFLSEFEREYYRVSQASSDFVTDISSYMTEARDVWKALRKKDKRLAALNKQIATGKKKLSSATKKAKEKAAELDAKEKELDTLKKEIKALTDAKDESKKGKRTLRSKNRVEVRLAKRLATAKQRKEAAAKAEKQWQAQVKSLQAQEKKITDAAKRRQEIMADLVNLTKPWQAKVKVELANIEKEAATFNIKFIPIKGAPIDLTGTDLLNNHSLKEVKAIFKQARALETAEKRKRRRRRKKKKKAPDPASVAIQQVDRHLPSKKERTQFAELWQWYHHYVKPLDEGLVKDADWVLGEIKQVGRAKKKPVMYIIANGGFFTPDDDEALLQANSDERPKTKSLSKHSHGFNLQFMQAMALHGFDQGINWSPTSIDGMHFELVEGVQNTLEKPKPAKKKRKKKKK